MATTMRSTVTTFLSAFPVRAIAAERPTAQQRRRARRGAAQVATTTTTPPAAPQKVEREYVRTSVKLTNYGHGRRETEIDGTRVGIAWDGAKSVFVYVIGRKTFAGGATRDVAVAKLNAALAESGLPPVRA